MNIKALRLKKRTLEGSAKAKLAEITDTTSAEDAAKIEGEHKRLLDEIKQLDEQIRTMKADDSDMSQARAVKDGSDDDDEDEDDEDEDDEDDADANGDAKRMLSRTHMTELVAIDTQARGLGVDLDLAKAVAKGEKPDAMRKRLFVELSKKSADKGPTGGGGARVTRDEREGVSQSLELALIQRVLGYSGMEYKPKSAIEQRFASQYAKQAEQYRDFSLLDVAAKLVNWQSRGGFLRSTDAVEIFTRAFHTTSDFPKLLENVMNKSLLARYTLMPPTYRQLSIQRNFNDFRPHPQYRAGDFPNLQPISETGEIAYGTTTESKETLSVSKYGIVIGFSLEAMVNDDLGAINQILGNAGERVQQFENKTFFTMFNSNPTLLTDSVAVFASGHGNLAGSGAAPSVTTIDAARAALRQMTSLGGDYLNVPPAIIVTGPTTETVADQMVTTITPTVFSSVNPFSGKLRNVTDAHITGNAWYICAEPASVPCFVWGLLSGYEGPRMRTFEPFGVQGMKMSLEHFFGCGAIDYRGFYKNPGA